MTVYLVSTGRYSDWNIEGIFSTREKAEAYRAEIRKTWASGDPTNDVEEWEVDAGVGEQAMRMWSVCIRIDSGDISPQGNSDGYMDMAKPGACKVELAFGNAWIRVESPVSAEHAIKVAVEKRQEWLRNRAMEAPPE